MDTTTNISTGSVSLKLNSKNFLNNLGAIFTSSQRLLQELIQNANRANATHINIEFNEIDNVLTVSDDGIGIDDMQKLFTIAESGWDSSVQSQHPYGMGFIGVLFNCEEITISSKGKLLQAKSKDILNNQPTEVKETLDSSNKTIIVLSGLNKNFKMYLKEIDQGASSLARGYDLPVLFNGTKLLNLDSKSYLGSNSSYIAYEFEYGTIYANINNIGYYNTFNFSQKAMSHRPTLYLQGAQIDIIDTTSSLSHNPKANNIVIHFNDKVRARMPDRAQCVDAQIISEAIDAESLNIKRKIVEKNISLKGSEWFYESESHWLMGIAVTPELISELDELIGDALYDASEFNFSLADKDYRITKRSYIKKSEILNDEYLLFDEPELENDESNISELYTANLEKAAFVSACEIYHKGTKWTEILKAKMKALPNEDDITIQPINSRGSYRFNGIQISICVELCDEIKLTGEFGDVSITHTPVFDGSTVYITDKMDCEGVLYSISSYNDEYGELNVSALSEDTDNLENLKILMKCKDSVQMLKEMIGKNDNLNSLRDLLKGGSLNVTFDPKGNLTITENNL